MDATDTVIAASQQTPLKPVPPEGGSIEIVRCMAPEREFVLVNFGRTLLLFDYAIEWGETQHLRRATKAEAEAVRNHGESLNGPAKEGWGKRFGESGHWFLAPDPHDGDLWEKYQEVMDDWDSSAGGLYGFPWWRWMFAKKYHPMWFVFVLD